MTRVFKHILAMLAAAVLIAAAAPARADGEGEAPPDSLAEGEEEPAYLPPGERPFQNREVATGAEAVSLFHPNYKLTYKRDQDVSSWDHGFQLDYPLSERLSFRAGSQIAIRETEVLNRTNRQENWSAGLDVNVSSAVKMGIALNRIEQLDVRNEGLSNEVRSFREKETIDLTTGYTKTLLSGLDAAINVSAGSEKNVYADVRSRGSAQTIAASLAYAPAADVKGSVTYSGNHSLLDSEQGALESKDESVNHNLGATVDYTWGEHALSANVGRNTSTKEYPKDEQKERRDQDGESTGIKGTFKLLPGFETTLGYDYSRTTSTYDLEPARNSDLATRAVDASVKYSLAGTDVSAELRSETKRNEYYNEQTGDSYGQTLGATVTRRFGDRLNATLRGRMSLYSHHYDDAEENDQDRDLFDQEATFTLDYTPRTDITAGLTLRVREDNLIYIRRTRTGDNKTAQTYSVQPSIKKTFSPTVSVSQRYELSADYTFYTYDKDRNFLVRNFAVTTALDWTVRAPLKATVAHTYRGQDEGSYVEDEAGDVGYGKNSERDDHSIKITAGYEFFDAIDFEVSEEFSVQQKWNVNDGERELSWEKFDTTVTGKAAVDYTLEDGTTLKLSVGRTERDATNLIERQRRIWNINVSIDKTF